MYQHELRPGLGGRFSFFCELQTKSLKQEPPPTPSPLLCATPRCSILVPVPLLQQAAASYATLPPNFFHKAPPICRSDFRVLKTTDTSEPLLTHTHTVSAKLLTPPSQEGLVFTRSNNSSKALPSLLHLGLAMEKIGMLLRPASSA